MLIKDLIKLLEDEYQKQLPLSDMMGEPGIMIDVFSEKEKGFEYQGFSKEIFITRSSDGVYPIITVFLIEGEEKENLLQKQKDILDKS